MTAKFERVNDPLKDLEAYTKSLGWKVKEHDLAWLHGQPAGLCHTREKEIHIEKRLSRDKKIKTLLHELAHVINYQDEALAVITAKQLADSLNIYVEGTFDEI